MLPLIYFSIGTAIAVPYSAASAVDRIPELTVFDLKRDWRVHTGKSVEVRGQFDSCGLGYCHLCPEEMTTRTFTLDECLSIQFGGDTPGAQPDERYGYLQQELYKFATVTLTGRFDGRCLDRTARCLSSPINLSAPRVLEVHRRKSVLDGLVGGIEGQLLPAASDQRQAMLAEFSAVVPFYPGRTREVFQVQPTIELKGSPEVPNGVGCVCLETSCEGRWPTRLIEWINSPANPFQCWMMQEKGRGWRVLPGYWGGG